jgi:hypothetical protein
MDDQVKNSLAKVPLDKFEAIAADLGAAGVGWAIEHLRRFAPFVGFHRKGYDDSLDRLAFESALCLERWLMIETKAYEKVGEDCDPLIDDASTILYQLRPLIETYIRQPRKGGRTPDNRRYICASVCSDIWREFHPTAGSNSDVLLACCEAYWQACGQPPTAADLSGHLRNWKWFLTSNSREKSEVR